MFFQRLYQLFVQFRDFIIFILFVIISLSLISIGDTSAISGFRAFVVGAIGWINDKVMFVPNVSALKNENQTLRELNLELSNEVTQNYIAQKENDNLRKLMELPKKLSKPIEFADVVGYEKIGNKNYLIINKGSSDSLDFGMVVRTDAGLLGTIAMVSKKYSIVETIFNPDVKISAKIPSQSLFGIVVWDGESSLLLKNIPRTVKVNKWDEVVTSNFSSRYPADVPIGKIRSISVEPGTLFHRIEIEPYAKFNQVGQVAIIKELPDSAKINLIKKFFKVSE
ncbi:MAG TPA: rod shape-determining protein MreC [Candidatus Kapabacteria bacterium]|jgi:rod shape-determining protein MreC|nr:rod shape-determining protein MreC [Candidatus Kapabacteria bacterium]HOV91574.1 rod shape-determining protein MreC [Candidatus Kapabacteria bacterium]